jgi:hypothetical protein
MLSAKETLKGLCVHEMIVQKENNVPHLCVKKTADQAIEKTTEAIIEETAKIHLEPLQKSDGESKQ